MKVRDFNVFQVPKRHTLVSDRIHLEKAGIVVNSENMPPKLRLQIFLHDVAMRTFAPPATTSADNHELRVVILIAVT